MDELSQALEQRVAGQLKLLAIAGPILPQRDAPYFGHLRIVTAGGTNEVLLASEMKSRGELSVVDWRRSALTEVFLGCEEGEDYEVERDGRTLTGRLLEKNLVRFEKGALVEVVTPTARLWRDGECWRPAPLEIQPRLKPRPRASRRRPSAAVELCELDLSQRRAVHLPAGRATLVLGEAGCGKTTVALHRLAHLKRSARGRFKAAVIVPTEGLRRLTELLLERMEVPGVEVWLYDRWAARQARRAFPDLPSREGLDASAGVLRVKRHPAVRAVLQEVAKLAPARPDEDERLIPSRARARRHDLQRIFGDRRMLARIVADSDGAIPLPAIDETFEHTRVQFCQTAEDEYAYVDAANLITLDGRLIDEGTPMEDAGSIDVEDYAVLFALDRLRARRRGSGAAAVEEYDCLVLDEAQEFAPLELELIGRGLSSRGTLIVAGDAEQQIDPTTCFLGWDAALRELGAEEYETATLQIGYRCPKEVTALGRHVLDAAAPMPPMGERSPVALAPFDSELHLVAWILQAVRDLAARDPKACVALICRSDEAARRLASYVRRGAVVRLAVGGEFLFRAGVSATCVREVKGLEFDHVIVADATQDAWPDTRESRRALYVAATRAMRQLVMASVGEPTPLVADSPE